MELRPYQIQAKKAVQAEWTTGRKKTLLVLPTGCHAFGSRLLMADGSIKAVEDIQCGEFLLGSNGTPRKILHLVRGDGPLYRIIPKKGSPFVVSEDHQLTLIRTAERARPKYPCYDRAGEVVDITVREWLSWSPYMKHLYKLMRTDGIEVFPVETHPITISPYFLGILLGDGGITASINVTTPDVEVVRCLEDEAQHYNMRLSITPAGKANTYSFVRVNGRSGRNVSLLHQYLRDMGLRRLSSGDKHIPHGYKTLPRDLRLEVIAGLIDSDGSLTVNGYDFISKSRRLSDDLAFMCRSVGLAAYVKECKKSCQTGFTGTYYRVSISGECSIIPCRVERKQAAKRRQKKSVLRTGFTVEPAGSGKYYGFTVDNDNRYLLDDFTITHNCGKTIVFSKLAEDSVRAGNRVLILAHRGELLDQAADKLMQSTGLGCAVEKAEESCFGSWYRIVVGSVQSLMNEKRLRRFASDFFDVIIVDEAHHVLSDSYQRVLRHFDCANILGVTATPDRGDRKNLGQYFDSLAYEYTLPKAIKEGYLSPIKAQTIPLKLDIRGVSLQSGDFKAADLGTALEPYLYQIADEMAAHCQDRKTVVFLPLIKTSQKFRNILCQKGFAAAEVNGESADRGRLLSEFDAGKYNILCNSMLLTEGWDCPSVDCIVVLRPTKIRSLYTQMVGRGTRLHPGKDHLLLLDFLWHTERHELCHPAHLISPSDEIAKKMTENIEMTGCPVDIGEAEKQASDDIVASREESLAKELQAMKSRKREFVNPLQYEMSIQAEDLINYIPNFGWEMSPPSNEQIKFLEKKGIDPNMIDNAGKASKLIDRLKKRAIEGLATPKQIRKLEQKGFLHVGRWSFDEANKLIDRIAANGWKVPYGIDPVKYSEDMAR